MFDAGTSATIHERVAGHFQAGDAVRATVDHAGPRVGRIIGWYSVSDTVRHARVAFDGLPQEVVVAVHHLQHAGGSDA